MLTDWSSRSSILSGNNRLNFKVIFRGNSGFSTLTRYLCHIASRSSTKKNLNSVAVVRKRTIPTEWPPLVGEVSANVCGQRVLRGLAQRIPTAVNLCFLDRSRYFSIQVALQLSSLGWVDTVPDPLLLRKSGRAGNRTRDLWICNQKLWPLDHRGGRLDSQLMRDNSEFSLGRHSTNLVLRGTEIFTREVHHVPQRYTTCSHTTAQAGRYRHLKAEACKFLQARCVVDKVTLELSFLRSTLVFRVNLNSTNFPNSSITAPPPPNMWDSSDQGEQY
jgi:hypothetical protein